jgi:hypothetical protein
VDSRNPVASASRSSRSQAGSAADETSKSFLIFDF